MTKLEQINKDIIAAMKKKDKLLKDTLLIVKSKMQDESIRLKRALNNEEEISILKREHKQLKDGLRSAIDAGRTDISDRYQKQLEYVDKYLPQMMTEDEIKQFLVSKGATKDMKFGALMGMVMKEHKSDTDASVVRKVIETKFQ